MNPLNHFGIRTRMIRGDTKSYNRSVIVYHDSDGHIQTSPNGGYDIIISNGVSDKRLAYTRLLARLKRLNPKIRVASYSATKTRKKYYPISRQIR